MWKDEPVNIGSFDVCSHVKPVVGVYILHLCNKGRFSLLVLVMAPTTLTDVLEAELEVCVNLTELKVLAAPISIFKKYSHVTESKNESEIAFGYIGRLLSASSSSRKLSP